MLKKGHRWRIGRGSKIRVWPDPSIPSTSPFKTTEYGSEGPHLTTILGSGRNSLSVNVIFSSLLKMIDMKHSNMYPGN